MPDPVSETLTTIIPPSVRAVETEKFTAGLPLHRFQGVAHEIEQNLLDLDLVDEHAVDAGPG